MPKLVSLRRIKCLGLFRVAKAYPMFIGIRSAIVLGFMEKYSQDIK